VTLAAAKVGQVYLDPDIDEEAITTKTQLALALSVFAFLYALVLDKIGDKMIRGGKFHQALTKVMLSQGLMVGFSWEQCFFPAEENITRGPVSAMGCSLLLCVIVLPAYRWFVLPKILHAQHEAQGQL